MEAIPLCDIIEVYIIYVYTQQYSTIVSNYNFIHMFVICFYISHLTVV